MDYEQFFMELKECYSSHGLEFNYDFDSSVVKSWKNHFNKWGRILMSKYGLKNPRPFVFDKYSTGPDIKKSWNALQDKYAHASSAIKSSIYALRPRVFFGVADMVYTLAWELSCEIGRLPDSLHARMVLSTDDHRARRNYIENHGV